MSKILFGVVCPLTRAGCFLEFGGFDFQFFRFFGETLGGEFRGTVPVFVQHAFREVAEEGIGVFGCARLGGRWVRFCVLWKSVAGDDSIGSEDGFNEFLLRAGWQGWLIGDGFEFQIFVVVKEIETNLLFGADRFDGALDAGWQAVQLAHNVREEGDRGFEDVIDADAHGLVEEEFHLQESQLLVDESAALSTIAPPSELAWG